MKHLYEVIEPNDFSLYGKEKDKQFGRAILQIINFNEPFSFAEPLCEYDILDADEAYLVFVMDSDLRNENEPPILEVFAEIN